ncbi:MAG: hypothetical protein K2Y29_15495 [Beijerinckiaceae bacterium]|nr:hypothetical protein [Beijerinckiaceae bacterium]
MRGNARVQLDMGERWTSAEAMMTDNHAMLGSTCLVCHEAGASPFTDDLEDCCADCGRMLTFRPYLASESPKLCRGCFAKRRDALGRRDIRADA